jgi:hypothetical protein
MAYLVTNQHYDMAFICENQTDLHVQIKDYANYESGLVGHIIDITDEQFAALQIREKTFKWENNTATFPNDNPIVFNSKEDLDAYIKLIKDSITGLLSWKYTQNSAYKTKLEQYLSVLNNLDTSSISYPLNSSLEKHLRDNGHTIVSYLQVA